MPTDAQNAYMADTFGVDPGTYPASNVSSGGATASDDAYAADALGADAAASPADDTTSAAPQDAGTAGADAGATLPAGATTGTTDATQESDAAAEKPTLSVKSNGDGTFTLSGSGFVGNTAYIRAVGTGAKDYAYGQAWGSVPVSGGSFSATTPDVCGTEGGDRFFSANDGRPDASDKTGTLWSNTIKVSCPNAGGGDDPGDDPGGDPGDPADPGAGDKGAGDDGAAGGTAAAGEDQGQAAGAGGDPNAGDTTAVTAAAPEDAGTAGADAGATLPAGATTGTTDTTQESDAAAEKPTLSVKSNGDGTFTLSGSGFVGNIAYIRAVGTGAKDYAYGQAWGSVPVSGGSFSATTPDVCGTEGGDRFFSANDGRPDASDKTGTLWSNTVKVSCPNAGGGGGDDPGDDPGGDPADPGAGDKSDGSGGGDAAAAGADQGAAAGASNTQADTASAPDGTTASNASAILPAGATASPDAATGPDAGAGTDSVMGAGAAPAGSVGIASIEFNAFIPGSLGSKFNSFNHPKDLKNQAAFEAALSGVSGTWLEEPGSFAGLSSGPWLFSTDDRGFGGGSHRVGSTGTIDPANIGAMKAKGTAFKHTTSGSSHGRWVHTGTFTSSNETGSLEGPVFKNSNVSGSQDYTDSSADSSVVTIEASGSYPFATIAPSIDYKLVLTVSRDASGNVTISGDITTNKFPFYELIINGSRVWSFSSADKGPTIPNLSSSVTSKLAPVKL